MTLTVSPWLVWGVLSLALFGVVFWWRVARSWALAAADWWRYRGGEDQGGEGEAEALEELPPERSREELGFTRPGAPVRETMADKPGGYLTTEALLAPERTREELGFTVALPRLGGRLTSRGYEPVEVDQEAAESWLAAHRERRAPWWEAEHRAAYESLGFEYPSGLMARVRELTP